MRGDPKSIFAGEGRREEEKIRLLTQLLGICILYRSVRKYKDRLGLNRSTQRVPSFSDRVVLQVRVTKDGGDSRREGDLGAINSLPPFPRPSLPPPTPPLAPTPTSSPLTPPKPHPDTALNLTSNAYPRTPTPLPPPPNVFFSGVSRRKLWRRRGYLTSCGMLGGRRRRIGRTPIWSRMRCPTSPSTAGRSLWLWRGGWNRGESSRLTTGRPLLRCVCERVGGRAGGIAP